MIGARGRAAPASAALLAALALLLAPGCVGPVRPAPASDPRPAPTGFASWYGGSFHGRRTASGERFDMRGFTAAHRTLPFGTYLKVTSLANGRSVVVRINDRGPFSGGRMLDLSCAAAARIGALGSGVVRVRAERLDPQKGRRLHRRQLPVNPPGSSSKAGRCEPGRAG
ncbi:MAG TPA: septal ring lytic transglycosylase RlpA family protein [Candidatus Polarisedimenticolia bacterium]|nr:septal ring lytic transglycosylase RlpA family protein [Candidatus Polarisedimenticolia bacterium]